MIFQSFSKNLNLCVKYPWIENGAAGQPPVPHPGKYIQFVKHKYETEDEEEIAWLKKHKLFSEDESVQNTFWVFRPPVDKDAVIRERDSYIAKLEEENKALREATEKQKAASAPKAPKLTPVSSSTPQAAATGSAAPLKWEMPNTQK